MFDKVRSIKVSERVFDLVCEELSTVAQLLPQDYGYMDIDGWLETFNNCREQGYMLSVSDTYKSEGPYLPDMYIWVAENRNSDSIVVYMDSARGVNNQITEEAYSNRRFFSVDCYKEAASYIIACIKTKYYDFHKKA